MKKGLCLGITRSCISVILSALLTAGLVGCDSSEPAASASETAPVSTLPSAQNSEGIMLDDYQGLYNRYLNDLMATAILSTSWTSPEKIEPHNFVELYAWRWLTAHPEPRDPATELSYPAKELEDFIAARFDWSKSPLNLEGLHSKDNLGAHYDATNATYSFDGFGAPAATRVVEAVQNGDLLELTYEILSRADDTTVIQEGVLTVRLEEDNFRYLANQELYPKTTYEEEPSVMEELRTTYLYPVFIAGILNQTWDSPAELSPGKFSLFFTTLEEQGVDLGAYPLDENSDPMVPAEEFEQSIQKFFNISAERLRGSEYYHPNTKTYPWFGLGGASDCKVTAAQRDKKHLTLDYELIYDGLLATCTGTLILDLELDGSYKYVSNKTIQNPQVNTKAGQYILNVGFYQYGEIVKQAYAVYYNNRSGYTSAEVLHNDDLFSFFLNFYETPEDFYQKAANQYVFPVSAITNFLDQYFEDYTFNIGRVTSKITVKDGVVTCDSFTGRDTIKQQINVTAVTVIGEDQLRIDANLMELDDSEKIAGTTNVIIRVTDTGYHILSLNQ